MAFRTSISMQKGGVGKTTTTINLAGALANRGHTVLAFDADPQGALTVKLGFRDEYLNATNALYDVVLDQGEININKLDEIIISHDEYDLVPSHIRNFRLEKELHMATRSEERLRTALDRSDLNYDFILIDSPPNLGPLADGAILAAENVLFPSNANVISKHSLGILIEEIDSLEGIYDDYQITTIGGVLNALETHSLSSEVGDWFLETFGEENVHTVPNWAAIEHAIDYETSVFSYDSEDAGYPWDKQKIDELRSIYDQLAQSLEGYAQ